jgi:long-chain acyl-CoA synthetase
MKPVVVDISGQSLSHSELIEIGYARDNLGLSRNSWSLCSAGDRLYSVARTLLLLENEIPTLFCQLNENDDLAKSSLQFLQSELRVSSGLCAFLTSGSTGNPKLVVHKIENLRESSRKITQRFPELEGKRIHHLFPENYMAGVLNSTIIPFLTNGSILLDNKFDFRSSFTLFDRANQFESEYAWLSPSMISAITSQALRKRNQTPPWLVILAATGPLTQSVRDQCFDTLGIPIYNTFGTTESLFISTELQSGVGVNCGLPLVGVEPTIELSSGGQTAIGRGPLCIKSDTNAEYVFEGFKDLNGVITFRESPGYSKNHILTGDLCDLSEVGIQITGRTDDIVVLGGLNVSLSKIEAVARQYRGVIEVCASARFGGAISDLFLYYETAPDIDFSESSLQAFLTAELGFESTPRKLIRMSLPKTANGKIDRVKLRYKASSI